MSGEWEGRDKFDPRYAFNASKDRDSDRYTNIEECLNGTYPMEYVDYTQPENNINTLR